MQQISSYTGRHIDTTYLQLLGSLVNTLVNRLILFYKRQSEDQILFREEIQEIQDSLSYYQQFKPTMIHYSPLLQPLISHMKLNTVKQYFSNDVIHQLPQKQAESRKTMRSCKRRIYSSNNSLDVNRTKQNLESFTESTSIRSGWGLLGSQDRMGTTSVYLPDVSKNILKDGTRKGKSVKPHNYLKQVSKTYDKIIGSVVNTKTFKRKKYQNKIDNMVKMSEDPQFSG